MSGIIEAGSVEDMRCPECGNQDGFAMEVPAILVVERRDGVLVAALNATDPAFLWDEELWTRCSRCGNADTDRGFIEAHREHQEEPEQMEEDA